MILWLLAIGLISILGQVVLLRELNVAFYGSELIYILALGVWLFWTGAGALIGRRSHRPSAGAVRILLLVQGWLIPGVLVLIRESRLLFGVVPGAYLPFPQQLLAMVLLLFPIGVSLGLLFQWAAKLYVGDGRTLAGAYALESVGGLAGGVLATLSLAWGVQNFSAALTCALLAVLAASLSRPRVRSLWFHAAALLLAAPLVVALVWSGPLDRLLTSRNHPSLLETRDSPYGRITITGAGGQISVYENDALAFESEGTAAEEFVHLAAVQHPAPREVLVLGGGVEGLVLELLAHHPGRVDYVELNPVLLELLSRHLPPPVRASLRGEPVTVTVADPGRFLDRAPRYDLILVGMPEPDSGQSNRFYTREFFKRCSAHLNPGGVLAFRLRGAENLWTPQQTRRAASIHHALREVFADVLVLPGVTNVFLASTSRLPRDSGILGRRLDERGVEGRLVIPAYIDYVYTNDRFFSIRDELRETRVASNSDARPVCYQYTMLLWLSRFVPAAAVLEMPDLSPRQLPRQAGFWAVTGAAAILILIGRRRRMVRRVLIAAAAGCVGMILETVLILDYQIHRGVLYQDLGVLLTMFMAGLTLGAAVVDRAWRIKPHRWPASRLGGLTIVMALAALGLLLSLLLRGGASGSLAGTSLLLVGAGALVASLFAHASLHRLPDQRAVVSPLYSADLLGGSLGSLAASLLLIPAAGLAGSSLLGAVLALLVLSLL